MSLLAVSGSAVHQKHLDALSQLRSKKEVQAIKPSAAQSKILAVLQDCHKEFMSTVGSKQIQKAYTPKVQIDTSDEGTDSVIPSPKTKEEAIQYYHAISSSHINSEIRRLKVEEFFDFSNPDDVEDYFCRV